MLQACEAMSLKSAFVVGYTGATGKELVKELAKSKRFERVTLIGRRKVEYDDAELQKFVSKLTIFISPWSKFHRNARVFWSSFCCCLLLR